MYRRWMDHVRIGDVLRAGSGTLRTVRKVTLYKRGPKRGWLKSVTFTIMHCSWTNRCDTVLTYTDLDQRGFRPTNMRRKLRSKLDRLIARDIALSPIVKLTCCDVEGIY